MYNPILESLKDEKTPVQLAREFKEVLNELNSEIWPHERKQIVRILNEIHETLHRPLNTEMAFPLVWEPDCDDESGQLFFKSEPQDTIMLLELDRHVFSNMPGLKKFLGNENCDVEIVFRKKPFAEMPAE